MFHHKKPLVILVLALGSCSAAFAVPTPLQSDSPVPIEKVRVDNPNVLPLTGAWKFRLTHGHETANGYESGNHYDGPADASSEEDGHDPEEPLMDAGSQAIGRWRDFPARPTALRI